jgi:hypothetical protein
MEIDELITAPDGGVVYNTDESLFFGDVYPNNFFYNSHGLT